MSNQLIDLDQIKKNPALIQFVNNPSEEMCLVSVASSATNIQFIKNPSEKVWKTSLLRNPRNIKLISNPTDEMISFAIDKNFWVIDLFPNASLTHIILAYEKYKDSPHFANVIGNADYNDDREVDQKLIMDIFFKNHAQSNFDDSYLYVTKKQNLAKKIEGL